MNLGELGLPAAEDAARRPGKWLDQLRQLPEAGERQALRVVVRVAAADREAPVNHLLARKLGPDHPVRQETGVVRPGNQQHPAVEPGQLHRPAQQRAQSRKAPVQLGQSFRAARPEI